MKPPRFDYYAPNKIEEALSLLDQYGDDAKILAGGQSLMPLLNMRLSRPNVLIDINKIKELAYIDETADGGLRIGALARQSTAERLPVVSSRNPLLAAAIPYIGHFQIRNRGTIVGSLAHADPSAELPAIASVMGAEFVLSSSNGQRVVKADDFFVTYFTTAQEPTELLTEVRFPCWPTDASWGFEEVARRHGDFALAGVAAVVQQDASGICTHASITVFGVSDTPVRARKAEGALPGNKIDSSALKEVERLVSEELEPDSDIHASAEYRQDVGGVLARRALAAAIA